MRDEQHTAQEQAPAGGSEQDIAQEEGSAVSEYSQGVCHDGAAILKDGQPMTIEEILQELRDSNGWHQAATGLSGDLTTIGEQHDALAAFVNEAIDAAFDGCGLDGAWIQERAEELGLLTAETYDPERHPDADGTRFKPGDTIYVRQPWMASGAEDAE